MKGRCVIIALAALVVGAAGEDVAALAETLRAIAEVTAKDVQR